MNITIDKEDIKGLDIFDLKEYIEVVKKTKVYAITWLQWHDDCVQVRYLVDCKTKKLSGE